MKQAVPEIHEEGDEVRFESFCLVFVFVFVFVFGLKVFVFLTWLIYR